MPEPEEMGSMPKSAGRSGAFHSMTVNETVIALIRPKPDLDLVTEGAGRNPGGRAGRRRRPKGIGSISSYVTEVALPAKGYNDDNVCSVCR
ncbi:hypothetical protein ACFRAO_39170 [Streptomyces sp. NPDC056656]|uniref:hypothetical protein n=1 Tax=Streptomyces sp. NPDC056656 TaxID=3345895 RepID=UPI0036B48D4E